ncbi:MAG: DMT family transporter [Bacteroidales bacterium]|nr:DMT family transporter [Bacteroidales bacterium]
MTNQSRAYMFAIAAILCWSTIASAFKITLRFVNFLQLLLLASVFSTVILFLILIIQKKIGLIKKTTRTDMLKSAMMGFLNPFMYYVILLKAYSLLKAQEAGTLNYIWPITLVLLSIPLLKQKISWLSILAVIISFTGIIIISTEGHLLHLEFKNPLGVALALGSSVFWALYWILNIKDHRDEALKLSMNFLFGTVYIFFLVLIFSDFNSISWKGVAGSLYIGFFEMGLTYFLWLKALQLSVNTARVSNLVYLSPFISLIIIQIALKEMILLSTIAGLVFIVGGILLQQVTKTKP